MNLAGCTARPTAAWVAQQARNLAWTLTDAGTSPRFLIHDRDAKFPPAFDAVFAAEGVAVVRTPFQAPTANAYAERWIGSVRAESLDHLLVVNEAHLRHVLAGYVAHYNRARPHRGLDKQTPIPYAPTADGRPGQAAGCARRAHPRVRPRGSVARGPAGTRFAHPTVAAPGDRGRPSASPPTHTPGTSVHCRPSYPPPSYHQRTARLPQHRTTQQTRPAPRPRRRPRPTATRATRRGASRPPPPDPDCGDIPYTIFPVKQPDPHKFDGNNDGVGCDY